MAGGSRWLLACPSAWVPSRGANTTLPHLAWIGVNEHFNHPAKWQRLLGRLRHGLPADKYGRRREEEKRGGEEDVDDIGEEDVDDIAGCWTGRPSDAGFGWWRGHPNLYLDHLPCRRVFELFTLRHWPAMELHEHFCATLEINK